MTVPDVKFIDRIYQYTPNTFNQFKHVLNGKVDQDIQGRTVLGTGSINQCINNFLYRLAILPLDIPLRVLKNGTCAVAKAAELGWRTLGLLAVWKFSAQGKKWNITALQFVDYSLATALAPMKSAAEAARAAVGIFSPKTFYISPEKLAMHRRLNFEHKKLLNDIKQLDHSINSEGAENVIFLKVFFDYADRWRLASTKKPYFPKGIVYFKNGILSRWTSQRRDLLKKFDRLPKDPVKEKYALHLKFQELINRDWKGELICDNSSALSDFLNQNFKTNAQKQVIRNFFSKLDKVIEHSPFSYDAYEEHKWGKSAMKCTDEEWKEAEQKFKALFNYLKEEYENTQFPN